MEEIKQIKLYIDTDEPTQQMICEAYFERDKYFEYEFKDVIEKALDKLCISPLGQERLLNSLFMIEYKKRMKENKTRYVFDKNEFIKEKKNTEQFKVLNLKYEKLKKFIDSNNLLDFYKSLTIDELNDLGL